MKLKDLSNFEISMGFNDVAIKQKKSVRVLILLWLVVFLRVVQKVPHQKNISMEYANIDIAAWLVVKCKKNGGVA